jgi:hypothetical protein
MSARLMAAAPEPLALRACARARRLPRPVIMTMAAAAIEPV